MQVFLEDDLLNACTPGSRISVVGIYTALSPKAVGTISGNIEAVLLANSVSPLFRDHESQMRAVDIRYWPPPYALDIAVQSANAHIIPRLVNHYFVLTQQK